MLIYVTSLSASGLRDWLTQRITAVLLTVYTFTLLGFLLTHHPLTYHDWSLFFSQTWVKIFTLFVLFSVLFHAWIGMWIISTDYIKKSCIRLAFQLFIIFALLASLTAGIMIIWGF